MLVNVFNEIKFILEKEITEFYIYFFYENFFDINFFKKIAVWVLCQKKKKVICKTCESCINFKRNIQQNYYELLGDVPLTEIIYIINAKPIQSNLKIILMKINSNNYSFIEVIKRYNNNFKKTLFFFIINKIYIKYINNFLIENCFYINYSNLYNFFKIIKLLENYKINKLNYTINNSSKINVVNSLIYFFFKNLRKKNLKKEKIINILNLLTQYKDILNENENINITILIDFISFYFD